MISSSANLNELTKSASRDGVDKPEFMSCVAGTITQPRPRRVLRFCILFACIDLALAILCLSGLACLLTNLWWVFLLGFVSALPPVLFSFAAASKGCLGCIVGVSLGSLVNVSTSIGVVCAVMTVTQLSTHVYQACILGETLRNFQVDCSLYSSAELDYYSYIYSIGVFITALAVIYGVCVTVLSGITMVYSFFLARRVSKQGPMWLKIPPRFSQTNSVHQRSISFGSRV